MKNLLLYLLFLCTYNYTSAQNLLPLDWKLSSSQNTFQDSINLLVSWEHQGHFWHDGDCVLSSDFNVEDTTTSYTLTSKLQCFVRNISINGVLIGENISTSFWSNRKACTYISLPRSILHHGLNHIDIFCKNLSYTGGISHNVCTLTSDTIIRESISIGIKPTNHILTTKDAILTLNHRTAQNGCIRLRIENDFHKQILDTTWRIAPDDSISSINLKPYLSDAGFYQCMAVMHAKGYCGDVQWIGLNPENIKCRRTKDAEFDSYWAKAKAELAAVSPKFNMYQVDSLCNDYRIGYIVEMQSLQGITVRGYYFVPRHQKKSAVVMHVPGYGWDYGDLSQFLNSKNKNIAEFALCVRGHGISADVFNPGFGIPGVWGYKIYDKDSLAYRAIYMDCIRAVEFLSGRKEIDHSKIAVMGGSQGGGLALATAALCADKIAACAYFDPFLCDIRHQILTRTICLTELSLYADYYDNKASFDEILRNEDMIDTYFFAPFITCPIHYATALFDDDCPPHVGFAAYNEITSPKCYTVYPYDSHLSESDYSSMFIQWIKDVLIQD